MLVRLRLNLKVEDLAFCFGISASSVSRYMTTWVCFLYHHLKELEWSPPSVEQVMGTMPHSFRKQLPTTYAIIDGSEILSKHLPTFIYNPQHGAVTSTIILQNFLLLAHRMVPLVISQMFVLA